jgi:hypothetical protein
MTHPAPKYYYLKDRRPELYGPLVSNEAKFLDTTASPIDLDTDFFKGGFTYPSYEGGDEHSVTEDREGKP